MMSQLTVRRAPGLVTKDQARAMGPALTAVVSLWADATTDADSPRRLEYLKGKARCVGDFFEYSGKGPEAITELDVKAWQAHLESQDQTAATVYAKLSRVSSFYTWMLASDELGARIGRNPVNLARPKAPKPYQSAEALTDDEFNALLAAIPSKTLTGKRDRAMLFFYILTGHRRAEVCNLQWGNLKKDAGALLVRFKVKGGDYVTEEVNPICWDMLTEYLKTAGRLATMEKDTPLWVGHDRAGQARGALSSHSFAKNLKRYARLAGLDGIHVHQLRHTFGRMVAEDTGDYGAVQTAMGHKNLQTTKVYVPQISVKRDRYSAAIAARLWLGSNEGKE